MAKDEVKPKIAFDFPSYTSIVLDADKAVQLMMMLGEAQRYKTKYHSGKSNADGTASTAYTTEHVYPPEGSDQLFTNIRYLTAEQYALAKVAGKPSEG
jgi:hypothetical protein